MWNGFVGSFAGRPRDECLNEHLFDSLPDARRLFEVWRRDHNHERLHLRLIRLTPRVFANQTEVSETETELTSECGQAGDQIEFD